MIAADKPLPLCDKQEERTSTTVVNGKSYTISCARGFRVTEHSYYRAAVDVLGYPIKPFRYELDAELREDDLAHLGAYLTQNFQPGETVELWSIRVGDVTQRRPTHYSGSLADFDMETLAQLLKPPVTGGAPGQGRLTVCI